MTAVQSRDAMTLRAPFGNGRALDVAGVVLSIAAALWIGLVASRSGPSPAAVQALLAVTAACFVVGAFAARWGRWLVPALITAVVAVLLILSPAQMLSGRPLAGPFGYANATGALYVQGAAAALTLVASIRSRLMVIGALLATTAFVAVPFVIGSQVAALVAIGFTVAALTARNRIAVRALVLLCAALAAAALVFTLVLGATYEPESPRMLDRLVTKTLGERRPALWRDAWAIMASSPIDGVGHGNFASASPVARSDVDARWAHNEFLEQGAEAGIPGLALAVLIFAWALAKLWTDERQDAVTAMAACAVAALAIHASVDYVLHFPAVPAVTAALVGSATGAARSASRMEWH